MRKTENKKKVTTKIFQTCYVIGDELINGKIYPKTYGSEVCARTLSGAKKLIKHRGIKEILSNSKGKETTDKTFSHVYNYKRKDFQHWLCFLGYIALKSGRSADEIFGDLGIIHEMIHYITFSKKDLKMCDIDENKVITNYLKLCKDLGFLPNE